MICQHTVVDGIEYEWRVELDAAARAAAWVARAPQVLETDLKGMAEFFPHWVLVGSDGGCPCHCARCGAFLVPTDGAMRCVRCGKAGQVDELSWLGHVPALARPEQPFRRRQRALREAGFAEVTVGQVVYLLVPLTVSCPAEWPNVQPIVRYAPRWLDALGLPRNSAAHHLMQNGRACIFGWGQWSAMPIHAVLQQRMVNHITSLLKVAAGQRPREAFIGRVHHARQRPGR